MMPLKHEMAAGVSKLLKAGRLYNIAGTALAVCAGAEIGLTVYSLYKAKKAKSDRELKDWTITASICAIQGLGLMLLSSVMDTQSFVLSDIAVNITGQAAILDAVKAIKA